MTKTAIQPTQNEAFGFYGTTALSLPQQADAIWADASRAIIEITGCDADAARAFLDTRMGRHFADNVVEAITLGRSIERALEATIERWMGWTISRETERIEGIPAGLPYLTGYVMAAEIALA
jgi:hypothetical protein